MPDRRTDLDRVGVLEELEDLARRADARAVSSGLRMHVLLDIEADARAAASRAPKMSPEQLASIRRLFAADVAPRDAPPGV